MTRKRGFNMTHGSLFSGVGGFDLAAQWMGWENVLHCEINPFGRHVLKHYWPNATSYEDITKTDFTIWRGRIDVLTGGFPCQPFSLAGKRKGTEDERHLWPEMLRAIREIKPRWIVGENVFGLVSWNRGLVFEQVQADLEAEGYEVQPYVLPAAGVDAPHKRYRVWFVAYAAGNRRAGNGKELEAENGQSKSGKRRIMAGRLEGLCVCWNVADADDEKRNRRRCSTECKGKKDGQQGSGMEWTASRHGTERTTSDTCRPKLQRGIIDRGFESTWPLQADSGQPCGSVCSDWANFPTQPPVCDGNDGFSTELLRQRIRDDSMGYLSEKEIDKIISKARTEWRKESIKAGGNAIVHQVAERVFRAIDIYDNNLKS